MYQLIPGYQHMGETACIIAGGRLLSLFGPERWFDCPVPAGVLEKRLLELKVTTIVVSEGCEYASLSTAGGDIGPGVYELDEFLRKYKAAYGEFVEGEPYSPSVVPEYPAWDGCVVY